MSELTLFKGGLPAHLRGLDDDLTSTLAGGAGGGRRISIKGGVFREMIGSKEYRVSEERSIGVVIIKAAPKNYRTYFEGAYVEGENKAPTCWSVDEQSPAPDVPEDQRQATKCMDCPQNVKGSGQGESRACRYKRHIAVLLEGEIEKREVYQVILPATSVFGDGEKGKLPLQAYARHLQAHGTPIAGVITEMRFDTSVPTPKLVFKPVRGVTEDELEVIREMRTSPEAEEAIKMTVAPPKPKEALFEEPAPKKPAAAKKVAEGPVEEPKKVASKKPETATLESLVAGWDEE
jgi:hypothetical protein